MLVSVFVLKPNLSSFKADTLSETLLSTAQAMYRNFETNIPRNETARPRSQYYIHVSVSNLYIPRIILPILLQQNRWTDLGNI